MESASVRPAEADDLPSLTAIYNHYVVHTAVTFDTRQFSVGDRRPWFDDHMRGGPCRLLVCDLEGDPAVAYATTSRFRPKPAYDTSVEASVYCRPDVVGRGIGRLLYETLFESIAGEDIHRILAGVSLPNAASLALHRRCGFRDVGVFTEVGRKFDRYIDVAWFERPLRLPSD